jgi:anti-anti-sigma factor
MEVLCRFDWPVVEERWRSPSSAFSVEPEVGRRVQLVGELDIAGVPALRASLGDLDGDIELDCSGLTFIDCSGLRVLQNAQLACETAGVRLCLIAPAPCLTRLIDLAGLNGFFEIGVRPNP